jgi:superfamily II DNA or RNA helicase
MSILSLLRRRETPSAAEWHATLSSEGVQLGQSTESTSKALKGQALGGLVTQLLDDGLALPVEDGCLIPWDGYYAAIGLPAYANLPEVLALPPPTELRVSIASRDSLTDKSFGIAVGAWVAGNGARVDPEYKGAALVYRDRVELMQPEQWALFQQVRAFANRPDSQRDDQTHRQAWGRIRMHALAAKAGLDDFLHRSVVLTPERLDIALRRSEHVGSDTVVEVMPGFEGAPPRWLDAFDSARAVPGRYDIPTEEGIVQVLVTDKVRSVLEEIKRLKGRRLAGTRAQSFLLNPFATLGEDAKDVLDEAQFEQAREDAGLSYERFVPTFERDADGFPERVGLLIEAASAHGPTASETTWLTDEELGAFVSNLRTTLDRGHQLVFWQGNEFETQGDTPRHLDELQQALDERRKPRVLVKYAQVYDLSGYSSRIEGVGVEKPYYSPYIAKKKDDEGWFPENVTPVISYQPDGDSEAVVVPVNDRALAELREGAEKAQAEGRTHVSVPWLPKPISVSEALDVTSTIDRVVQEVKERTFDPDKKTGNRSAVPKKSLVLRGNIGGVDYEDRRREVLCASLGPPEIPRKLNPAYQLMEHQVEGLAWLQHLYSLQSEFQVRGAVLADDMGLGKTLQLLSLMAWIVEKDPNVKPMLVVAPVSLLENWKEEAEKFVPGALPLLTAYGDALAPLRVPRALIDERLRNEDGLVKFLRPGWVGSAKLVLTTYETLRDLEFSFAAEKWSLMVCDEAQRIKNPAAMVTRAAKKQNVAFKIACTGTPVENTLADLWCLFDFIQAGLLGALNDFGRRYRKPIEAKTEEEQARVSELRKRIEPQILRRMKEDVAKDLPKKVIVESCRRLKMSAPQRNLYAKAIEDFKRRGEAGFRTPLKNHLGLLHYLRIVCTDPRRHGLTVFKPEPVAQYRAASPKLDWLITQLNEIRDKQEKVIIFCEFRNIQRLLQHYVEAAFQYKADIINGDTSASSSHTASRQKRIKAFQAQAGFGVLILSPVAVGFGVNIQAANHVIHYTRTWNPAKEDQATDRAYRIGQKKDVYVYYPVVCADDFVTFDVKLDQLLASKRSLAGDMLDGSPDISLGEFRVEDVVPDADATDFDERVTFDHAMRMEWRHFEGLAAALWGKKGYEVVYCTPPAADNGVDVVAITGTAGELVQTKTSAVDGTALGWETVKDVVGGEAFYRRRHPQVEFAKVGLTNQFFNSLAHENATLNSVELLDQNHLAALLEEHHVTMLDVERILYTEWDEADIASA